MLKQLYLGDRAEGTIAGGVWGGVEPPPTSTLKNPSGVLKQIEGLAQRFRLCPSHDAHS